MKSHLSEAQGGVPEGSAAPDSAKPKAYVLTHPSEAHLHGFVREVTCGDANVVPIIRISRIAKKYAVSKEHYGRITHAMWNAVGHEHSGKRLLRDLREDDNREILQTIHDIQDLLGTSIGKGEDIVLMASPDLGLDLVKAGYNVVVSRRDFADGELTRDLHVLGFLNQMMDSNQDVSTGWRKWLGSRINGSRTLTSLPGYVEVLDYTR